MTTLTIANYVITSDPHQWIVSERRVRGADSKNAGEERLVPVGFYATLYDACTALLDRVTKESDATDVGSLIDAIHNAERGIAGAVEGVRRRIA